MPIQTNIHYEITDTCGGEANYSWVKRGKIECKPGEDYSNLAAVRRAKKSAGWENLRKQNQGKPSRQRREAREQKRNH